MPRNNLNEDGNYKEIISQMNEVTPNNISIIKEIISNNERQLGQIWELLNLELRQCTEIQEIFVQYTNNAMIGNTINKLKELGKTEDEIVDLLIERNYKLLENCLRFNRKELSDEMRKKAIIKEPKLAQYLTQIDLIGEILEIQPEIEKYLDPEILFKLKSSLKKQKNEQKNIKRLKKEQKEEISQMNEATPENITKIKHMVKNGAILSQIWELLSMELKQNVEIQETFIEYTRNKTRGRGKIIRDLKELGKTDDEILDMFINKNYELLEDFLRLKEKEISGEMRKKAIIRKPQLAHYLTQEDPLEEILEIQPQIAYYLSSKIPNKEELLLKAKFLEKERNNEIFFRFATGLEIKNDNDAMKVVEAYIRENKTIRQFCDKYMIEDEANFNILLNRYEKEFKNGIGLQIQEVKRQAQLRYMDFMKEEVSKILKKEKSIRKSIQQNDILNAYSFIDAKTFLDESDYNRIILKLYTGLGLHEYKRREKTDEYGVKSSLIGNLSIEEALSWFSKKGKPNVMAVKKGILKLIGIVNHKFSDMFWIEEKDKKKIETVIDTYLPKDKDKLLNNFSFVNNYGIEVKTTEQNLQLAIEYLNAKDRYICQQTVKNVLKAIGEGTLSIDDIQKEKEKKILRDEQQNRSKNEKMNKLKGITNVDEYIKLILEEPTIEKTEQEADESSERRRKIEKVKDLITLSHQQDAEILELEGQIQQKGNPIENE